MGHTHTKAVPVTNWIYILVDIVGVSNIAGNQYFDSYDI